MKNQIKKIENHLRYITKRNKNVTFSLGLTLVYLMLGVNAFSDKVITNIQNPIYNRERIGASTDKISSILKDIKGRSERRLKGAQLELIQLMEQGDQVVKSPWASWQFGINFIYNNWGGSYKGRGDKAEKYAFEGIFTRSSDIFERSASPLSENYSKLITSTNPYSASSTQRIGLNNNYGLASTISKQEPLSSLNVDASIRPKDVQRDPVQAPTVNINAPTFQALNVPNLMPPVVDIPTPSIRTSPVKIPAIDVNPITDYSFQHRSNTGKRWTEVKEIDGLGYTYWSGYNPETGKSERASRYWYDKDNKKLQEVDQTSEYEINPPHNKPLEALTYSTRVTNVFYLNHQNDRWTKPIGERGFVFDGKGVNIWVQGRENPEVGYPKGTIAMHTVWDGKISNVTGHLMGYSNFISTETWHAGKLTLNNVKVNVEKDDNSVFYIYPAGYEIITHGGFNSYRQRGEFNGDLNIDIKSKRNFVYVIMGTSGSYKIKSTGNYNITGSDNIVYLGYGYSPNFQNFLNQGEASGIVTDHDGKGMTPSIQLSTPVKSAGDDNIILMFGEIWKKKAPDSWINDNIDEWKKSLIGIYQGEIETKADIGTEAQIVEGNKVGKELAYVEGNIGVYARSGQRVGIKPEEDLGAVRERKRQPDPNNGPFAMPKYNLDSVHNLEIGAAEIYFGKYAKDGIMFAAEMGTVIDIAKSKKADRTATAETDYLEIAPSSEIKDSRGKLISSADENVNQAATGTVIAYANGVWDKNVHAQMSDTTKNNLDGKGSEINIYINQLQYQQEQKKIPYQWL